MLFFSTLLVVMRMRSQTGVVAVGLGSAQLIAWGTLYYAIAVLGEPMGAELNASHSAVFGTFTGALAISGLLAKWAGSTIDRYGGRAVLVASVLIGAAAFGVLGHAGSTGELAVGWSLAGLAMALGLYDACFAAIGQVRPDAYRKVVTSVTLIAGFASTVFWPLSHYLLQSIGWRALCDVYAAGLLLCVPIYLAVLPAAANKRAASVAPAPRVESVLDVAARRRARALSWAFAGTALVGGAMSAHLVVILSGLRLPDHQAIWIASAIGALQVLGRALELRFGSRLSAVQLGLVTFAGFCTAMLLLLGALAVAQLAFVFALFYGTANGLVTIVKATLPVELLGFENVGAVLGTFSAPSLVARALAPVGFALMSTHVGTQSALVALVAISVGSLAMYLVAARAPSL